VGLEVGDAGRERRRLAASAGAGREVGHGKELDRWVVLLVLLQHPRAEATCSAGEHRGVAVGVLDRIQGHRLPARAVLAGDRDRPHDRPTAAAAHSAPARELADALLRGHHRVSLM
jgi:hypothetical protein